MTFPQLKNASRQISHECPVLFLENPFAVIQTLSNKITGTKAGQEIFIKCSSSENTNFYYH